MPRFVQILSDLAIIPQSFEYPHVSNDLTHTYGAVQKIAGLKFETAGITSVVCMNII